MDISVSITCKRKLGVVLVSMVIMFSVVFLLFLHADYSLLGVVCGCLKRRQPEEAKRWNQGCIREGLGFEGSMQRRKACDSDRF
jgi:hypothetical protein